MLLRKQGKKAKKQQQKTKAEAEARALTAALRLPQPPRLIADAALQGGLALAGAARTQRGSRAGV